MIKLWFVLLILPAVYTARDSFKASNQETYFTNIKERETEIVALIDAFGKGVFPAAYRILTESDISIPCSASLLRLFTDFKKMKRWAWRMLDATAKPPAGILEGTLFFLGDYDECMDINLKNEEGESLLQGKYCLVEFRPFEFLLEFTKPRNESNFFTDFVKMLPDALPLGKGRAFHLGLCVPSKCSAQEINELISGVIGEIITPTKIDCKTKTKIIPNALQTVILCIFFLFVFMAVVGTGFDIIVQHTTLKIKQNELTKLLIGFSIYSNTIYLFSTLEYNRNLAPLRGCRVFSTAWIIIMHVYFLPGESHLLRYHRLVEYKEFNRDILFKTITGSTLALDSFFVLSGMIYAYIILNKLEKKEGWLEVTTYTVKRIIRVLVIEMLFIAIFMLAPLIMSGPISELSYKIPYEACLNNWWTTLLLIQNFWPMSQICLPHTWFIGALFMLFPLTYWIILVLDRRPKIGIAINVALIVFGCLLVGFLTSYLDLPAFINPLDDIDRLNRYFDLIHIRPYTYLSSYFIGFLLGYAIFTVENPKIKPRIQIISWLSAIIGALSALYGSYFFKYDGDREINIIYASLHRTVWSSSISWMIFACMKGYGGIINRFLSWKGLIPLDRLTLMTYLLHPLILAYHTSSIRGLMTLGHMDQLFYFSAAIGVVLFFSSLLNIIFEQPLRHIEAYIISQLSKIPFTNILHLQVAKSSTDVPVSGFKITFHSSKGTPEDINA